MTWLNEVDATQGTVIELRRTASDKGYVICCDNFDCFIWNNDKLLIHLLVAISAWSDAKEGKVLQVVRSTKEKRGFNVEPILLKGKPVSIAWNVTPTGFTTKELNPDDEINPFF